MFKLPFGLKRLLVELRRIANALEVIALYHAKKDGRMWNPRRGPLSLGGSSEKDELLHTNDDEMRIQQLRDAQEFRAEGWGDDE